mmetsp:Transcript_12855/g.27719  ORF Transcript_12855/g.27719 Transcript_12855/m.27719 type:complete len:282 (+) Transcript_12855:3273-4118(+)
MVQYHSSRDLLVQPPLQLQSLSLPSYIVVSPAAAAAMFATSPKLVVGHVGAVLLVPGVVTFRHHGRSVVFEDVEHSSEVGLTQSRRGEDCSRVRELFEDWTHVLAIPVGVQLDAPLPVMLPYHFGGDYLLPIQHLLHMFQHFELRRIASYLLLQTRPATLRDGQLVHLVDQRRHNRRFGIVALKLYDVRQCHQRCGKVSFARLLRRRYHLFHVRQSLLVVVLLVIAVGDAGESRTQERKGLLEVGVILRILIQSDCELGIFGLEHGLRPARELGEILTTLV